MFRYYNVNVLANWPNRTAPVDRRVSNRSCADSDSAGSLLSEDGWLTVLVTINRARSRFTGQWGRLYIRELE
jgi:hypothetical protein